MDANDLEHTGFRNRKVESGRANGYRKLNFKQRIFVGLPKDLLLLFRAKSFVRLAAAKTNEFLRTFLYTSN